MRRKLSEATRQRVADLASGWNISSEPSETKPVSPPRRPQGSVPPPASPGSLAEAETLPGDAPQRADRAVWIESHDASDPRLDPTLPSRATPTPRGAGTAHDETLVAPTSSRARASGHDDTLPSVVGPIEKPADGAIAKPAAPRRRAEPSEPVELPRRRGVWGDVRYVFTAAFGVPRTRRELAALDAALAHERALRGDALAQLAIAAVGDDAFEHPALDGARDALADIEARRARHAGAVAAAEVELSAVVRDRDADDDRLGAEIAAAEGALAEIVAELGPIERNVPTLRRRAAELKEYLQQLDVRLIGAETAARAAVRVGRADDGTRAADLAALKAERVAAAREHPRVVAELESLAPRLAQLSSRRAELEDRLARVRADHAAARARADERAAAINARGGAEERAAADAEAARKLALEDLGEQIYADRPEPLRFELVAIEEHDLQLAARQRRSMELRALLSSVDRGALARGIAVLAIVLAAIAASIVLAIAG